MLLDCTVHVCVCVLSNRRGRCDLIGFGSAARCARARRPVAAVCIRSAGGVALHIASLAAFHARTHRPAALLSLFSSQLGHLGIPVLLVF